MTARSNSEGRAVLVTKADARRTDQRVLLFLSDNIVNKPGARIQSLKLYHAFDAWCRASEEATCTHKTFTMAMTDAGYRRVTSKVVYFVDIMLRPQAIEVVETVIRE